MFISRFKHFSRIQPIRNAHIIQGTIRNKSGHPGILPEPPITRFGLLGIVGTVIAGLLIGAVISKSMANFLEENDLFVPSDDDDDDD